MVLMTVLSILAVDFPVFPRSLAKCETYGVSLVTTAQQFHSKTSLTALELTDGPRCGLVCIFAGSGFCDTDYQVPGPSVFSAEAKDCQGVTEMPPDMVAGFLAVNRCETVRLSCESTDRERPSET